VSNDWFVFEAKGRTNEFDAEALSKAKIQARQIQSINNQAPLCRVAAQSYFGSLGMCFRIDDPPAHKDGKRNIELDRGTFERAYFDPILEIIKSSDRTDRTEFYRRSFLGTEIRTADMWLGVAENVQVPIARVGIREPNHFLGRDGILVRLGASWTKEKMRMQPRER
jgi:hypothetical protein